MHSETLNATKNRPLISAADPPQNSQITRKMTKWAGHMSHPLPKKSNSMTDLLFIADDQAEQISGGNKGNGKGCKNKRFNINIMFFMPIFPNLTTNYGLLANFITSSDFYISPTAGSFPVLA